MAHHLEPEESASRGYLIRLSAPQSHCFDLPDCSPHIDRPTGWFERGRRGRRRRVKEDVRDCVGGGKKIPSSDRQAGRTDGAQFFQFFFFCWGGGVYRVTLSASLLLLLYGFHPHPTHTHWTFGLPGALFCILSKVTPPPSHNAVVEEQQRPLRMQRASHAALQQGCIDGIHLAFYVRILHKCLPEAIFLLLLKIEPQLIMTTFKHGIFGTDVLP